LKSTTGAFFNEKEQSNKTLKKRWFFGKMVLRNDMNTKLEYLDQLYLELKYLSVKKRKAIVARYQEKIDAELDYGIPEEKILAKLPDPYDAARSAYKEAGIDVAKKEKERFTAISLLASIFGGVLFLSLSGAFLTFLIFFFTSLSKSLALFNEAIRFSFFDAVITLSLGVIHFGTYVIAGIYIYELTLYLFNEISVKVKQTHPNATNRLWGVFRRLSFVRFFEKATKKEKIVAKTFLLFIVLFFSLGIISFVSNGYIRRVMTDQPANVMVVPIDLQGKTEIGIHIDTDEAKTHLHKSETNEFKIELRYEFDRAFSTTIENETIVFRMNPAIQYDVFDFFKEPIPQIHIYVPDSMSISTLSIRMDKGIVKATDQTIREIDVDVSTGQLFLDKTTHDHAKIRIGVGAVWMKEVRCDFLEIDVTNASIGIDGLLFDHFSLSNQFSNVKLNGLEGGFLWIDNQGGKTELTNSDIDMANFLSRNTRWTIANSELGLFSITGSSTEQIDIYESTASEIHIVMDKGTLTIEECVVFAEIDVYGANLFTMMIMVEATSLDYRAESGTFGVRDGIIERQIQVEIANGDLTLVECEASSIVVSTESGIIALTNIYAQSVYARMQQGDFSYKNDDLSRIITILELDINAANQNVSVGR